MALTFGWRSKATVCLNACGSTVDTAHLTELRNEYYLYFADGACNDNGWVWNEEYDKYRVCSSIKEYKAHVAITRSPQNHLVKALMKYEPEYLGVWESDLYGVRGSALSAPRRCTTTLSSPAPVGALSTVADQRDWTVQHRPHVFQQLGCRTLWGHFHNGHGAAGWWLVCACASTRRHRFPSRILRALRTTGLG